MTKYVYAHLHPKLERYDILIDLANIHTCSRKMYETGKISKKVLKKWRVRDRKNTAYNHRCKHKWFPETVFSCERFKHIDTKSGWRCIKCRCWCSDLHDDEFKNSGFYCEPYISRQKAYREKYSIVKAWTDYPLVEKGDIANQEAPIRECIVLSYDRDKYCWVMFPYLDNFKKEIKAGYLYTKSGRCGEVPTVSIKRLEKLPKDLSNEEETL